jgi:hypothetical protein
MVSDFDIFIFNQVLGIFNENLAHYYLNAFN